MARSVTLTEILRRATKRADMENSDFFTTEDKIDLLNGLYPELYDLLVSSAENYYVTSSTLSLVSGTQAYSLPADFYKLIGIDFQISPNSYATLFPYREAERNNPFGSSSNIPSGTVRVRYVPAPTVFSASDLSATIDGISGWDELVVVDLAIAMLEAEESDTRALQSRKNRLIERITAMSQNRDMSMPATITDVYAPRSIDVSDTLRYRLYGNNVEFISVEYLGVHW